MVVIRGVARTGLREEAVMRAVRGALAAVHRENADVSVSFVTDREIARLNSRYRATRGPTDVLSFGNGEGSDLGDVVISPAAARRKARAYGESYRSYLHRIIVHGILHLAGYDHEREGAAARMERLEQKILSRTAT